MLKKKKNRQQSIHAKSKTTTKTGRRKTIRRLGSVSGSQKSGSKKKLVLLGLGLLGLAAVAWKFGVFAKKESPFVEPQVQEKPKPKAKPKNGFPLVVGSIGSPVSLIQKKLNSLGFKLKIDGILGVKTKGAILKAGLKLPLTETAYKQFIGNFSGMDGVRDNIADVYALRNSTAYDAAKRAYPIQENALVGKLVAIRNNTVYFMAADKVVRAVPYYDVRYT